jgi:O-antigen ligase
VLSAGIDPLWLAALPAVVAIGIWAVVDLERFVLIAVLSAMIAPAALATPSSTQIALADVLLLVALGAWLVTGSARAVAGPWLAGNRLLAPALLFVAVNAESLAWSVRPRDTVIFVVQLVEIVIVLPIVFASIPRSLVEIRRGLLVFIGLTCVMAALTALNYAPHALAGDLEGRQLGATFHKNAVGSFVGAGLVLAYALWLGDASRRVKRLLVPAMLIEAAGLFSTVSRGAILGAFISLLVASFLLRRRRALTFGVAAVAAVMFLSIWGVASNTDRTYAGSYDSSVVRKYSFENAIEKISDRPVLGTGAGTYRDYIPQLVLTLPDPNNMFLLTWAELGVFGLVALLILLASYGRALFSARDLPDEAAVLAVGAGCVSLSLFVHFQLDVTWTRGTTSLAFAAMGLMLAATRLAPAVARQPARTVSYPRVLAPADPRLRRSA